MIHNALSQVSIGPLDVSLGLSLLKMATSLFGAMHILKYPGLLLLDVSKVGLLLVDGGDAAEVLGLVEVQHLVLVDVQTVAVRQTDLFHQ